jgi:hypothetical protein
LCRRRWCSGCCRSTAPWPPCTRRCGPSVRPTSWRSASASRASSARKTPPSRHSARR